MNRQITVAPGEPLVNSLQRFRDCQRSGLARGISGASRWSTEANKKGLQPGSPEAEAFPVSAASAYWQVIVRVFATGGIDSRYVPMSAASLGVMLARARIPQRATPFLSLAVVM